MLLLTYCSCGLGEVASRLGLANKYRVGSNKPMSSRLFPPWNSVSSVEKPYNHPGFHEFPFPPSTYKRLYILKVQLGLHLVVLVKYLFIEPGKLW